MTLTEAYIREFEKFRQATPPTPKPAKPGAVQNVLTGVAPGINTQVENDTMSNRPARFNPHGVRGKLLKGHDEKFYFVPADTKDLRDMEEHLDVAVWSYGDFENAVRVSIETLT